MTSIMAPAQMPPAQPHDKTRTPQIGEALRRGHSDTPRGALR